MTEKYCGIVSLLGPTNVGKSTLLNHVLTVPIAAVSPKVQTTRFAMRGIHTEGQSQLLFIDAPGLFEPHYALDRDMLKRAWDAYHESDIGLIIIDAAKPIDPVITLLQGKLDTKKTHVGVINKIDLISKEALLPLAKRLSDLIGSSDIFMIAAHQGKGVPDLLAWLSSHVPAGEWLYDENEITTMSSGALTAELTREQVYYLLQQELPYAIAVGTDHMEQSARFLTIHQTIYVQTQSHKSIVIGKQGSMLSQIGERARKRIGHVLDRPVVLKLHVKVDPKALFNLRME